MSNRICNSHHVVQHDRGAAKKYFESNNKKAKDPGLKPYEPKKKLGFIKLTDLKK